MIKQDYPSCKYCGTKHGMGIEDMATGEITPIDVCKDCLFLHTSYLTSQIQEKSLDELVKQAQELHLGYS